MLKTNTNKYIFGLIKRGKHKYKYIWGDKKGQIQTQILIFRLIFANTNMNTNIHHTPVVLHAYNLCDSPAASLSKEELRATTQGRKAGI